VTAGTNIREITAMEGHMPELGLRVRKEDLRLARARENAAQMTEGLIEGERLRVSGKCPFSRGIEDIKEGENCAKVGISFPGGSHPLMFNIVNIISKKRIDHGFVILANIQDLAGGFEITFFTKTKTGWISKCHSNS